LLQPVGFVTFSTRAGAEAAKQDLQVSWFQTFNCKLPIEEKIRARVSTEATTRRLTNQPRLQQPFKKLDFLHLKFYTTREEVDLYFIQQFPLTQNVYKSMHTLAQILYFPFEKLLQLGTCLNKGLQRDIAYILCAF
jgi:hypothetical protein